jgi:1-acyl-sn-glycerol-3-phosphate acyltransferase
VGRSLSNPPGRSSVRPPVLGNNPFEPTGSTPPAATQPPVCEQVAKAEPPAGKQAASRKAKPPRNVSPKATKKRVAPEPERVTFEPSATAADNRTHPSAAAADREPAVAGDRMGQHSEVRLGAGARGRLHAPTHVAEPRRRSMSDQIVDGELDGTRMDAARRLLSAGYYTRIWSRLAMRNRSEVVDDFGYDPKYDQRVRPLLDFLYARYFRAQAGGIENIPAQGRALVVSNHSGMLPFDAVMLKTAIAREHPRQRLLRWLAEDQVFYLPFLGSVMNRMGSVRACQQNAERLLRGGHLVGVFPEGMKGSGRLYRDRYKLQRFGRGGFVRLCLRTNTPLVPCAIVGAEDAMPLLHRLESPARLLGVPFLPITPTFPLLGPLGLLPVPTRWQFMFGEPIGLDGYGPDAEQDHVLVGRLSERVRATIQSMIDGMVHQRRSVWFA